MGARGRTFLSMALDDERCCFCRREIGIREWAARPGWLEVECPVCGLFRVERQFWVTAHFKKARKPVLYRQLAWWLEASRATWTPVGAARTQARLPQHVWEHGNVVLVCASRM